MLLDRVDERFGRDLDAEVDDLEAGALEHDVDEVLADVVDIALDRPHQERPDFLGAGVGEERTEDLECAAHRTPGDQHLGDEEIAALEARADLLERRNQRVEEHLLGPEAVLEPLLGQLHDRRLVADERAVVEAGEDLVMSHAIAVPSCLWLRRWSESAAAASTTC